MSLHYPAADDVVPPTEIGVCVLTVHHSVSVIDASVVFASRDVRTRVRQELEWGVGQQPVEVEPCDNDARVPGTCGRR